MKHVIPVLLIVLTLSFNAWALKDDKALMLYLPFDEGNGDTAKDASGNNLEATLHLLRARSPML